MDVNSKGEQNIFLWRLLFLFQNDLVFFLFFLSIFHLNVLPFQSFCVTIWTTRVIGLLLNCMASWRFISHRLFSIRRREYLIVCPPPSTIWTKKKQKMRNRKRFMYRYQSFRFVSFRFNSMLYIVSTIKFIHDQNVVQEINLDAFPKYTQQFDEVNKIFFNNLYIRILDFSYEKKTRKWNIYQ